MTVFESLVQCATSIKRHFSVKPRKKNRTPEKALLCLSQVTVHEKKRQQTDAFKLKIYSGAIVCAITFLKQGTEIVLHEHRRK